MAYNGALLLDDDGKIRLNAAGQASNDSLCDLDCGTSAGPLSLTPPNQTSKFCTCCVPDGWDIDCHFTTTGPQDFGKVVIEYGPGESAINPATGEEFEYCDDNKSGGVKLAKCPVRQVSSPQQTIALNGIEGGSIRGLGGIIPAEIEIKTYGAQDDCDHTSTDIYFDIGPNYCGVLNDPELNGGPPCYFLTLPDCISWFSTTTTRKCAKISITDQYTPAAGSTPAKYKWILTITGAPDHYDFSDPNYVKFYDLFYGEHEFTADDSGEFHYDCRSELEFTSATNPKTGKPASAFGVFSDPAPLWKSLPLGSGGTVTLKPCTTHKIIEKCDDPTEVTTGGRCLFEWDNNSGGVYPTFHWTNWNLVSSTYVPPGGKLPLPPEAQLNTPVIVVADNGSCRATIYTVGPSDTAGGCPKPVPPSAVPSSYKCKPRFACAKVWESRHLTSGWSTPTAVADAVICIDTQNPQTPLDDWGPLQPGCKKYFYQYLGHTCIGTSDTATCVGLNSTTVPAVPTDNPGCYAEDLATGCTGCPSNKCDHYRFAAQIPEGGGDPELTGPYLVDSNVDCPGTCDSGWGPDTVADRASRRDVYVCHDAAAPSQPPDAPDSGDYS